MLLTPNQQRQLYRIHAIDQAEAERRDRRAERRVRYGPLTLFVFTAAFWWTVFLWVW